MLVELIEHVNWFYLLVGVVVGFVLGRIASYLE